MCVTVCPCKRKSEKERKEEREFGKEKKNEEKEGTVKQCMSQ